MDLTRLVKFTVMTNEQSIYLSYTVYNSLPRFGIFPSISIAGSTSFSSLKKKEKAD